MKIWIVVTVVLVAAIAAISLPAIAQAQTPPGFCKAALDQYNRNEEVRWRTRALQDADNSAPRATLAEIRILNELIAELINVNLMVAYKCALPATVASSNPDPLRSTRCASAMLRQQAERALTNSASAETPKECK
ncbi:MAG: hypothetical protein HYR63_26055 [Proteobacteria bacterium]|nr:hypothetical protein [Pseudomonadota bacterium]